MKIVKTINYGITRDENEYLKAFNNLYQMAKLFNQQKAFLTPKRLNNAREMLTQLELNSNFNTKYNPLLQECRTLIETTPNIIRRKTI